MTTRQRRPFAGAILALASEAPPSDGDTGTVLVADDDMNVRETLRDLLELASHDVLVAEDGAQVLELLDSHDVDVVILDLDMPNVDGWTVLRELTAHRPVVIVHTGKDLTPRDMREFFAARPYGVLPKPVSPMRMLAAVAGAVAHARATA